MREKERYKKALESVRGMSPEEIFQESVRVGVHHPDGTLTPAYGGLTDLEKVFGRDLELDPYDPDEDARAKQLSRDRDAADLASGAKSRDELRAENAAIAISYDDLVIDFSQCRPGCLR